MPYEYTTRGGGLGWSEIPWYGRGALACWGEHSRPVCFTNTPQDQAAIAANDCVDPWSGASACTTAEGNAGAFKCCPEGRPVPLPTSSETPQMQEEREAALRRIAQEYPEEAPVEEPKPTPTPAPRGQTEFTGTKAFGWQWTAFGIFGLTAAAVLGWIYYTGRSAEAREELESLPERLSFDFDRPWR